MVALTPRPGLIFVSLFALASWLPHAHAADAPLDEAYGLRRPWLFVGTDLGYNYLSANTSVTGEPNKSGVQWNLKGLGSFYFTRWIGDLGFGWQYNRVSGDLPPVTDISVIVRSVFFELSPRYRLTPRMSLGPTFAYNFGTDLSFSQTVLSTNDQNLWTGGVQFFYEIPTESTRIRVGARAMTDLSMQSRQLWTAQLSVQIGLPILAPPSPRAPAPEPKPDVEVTLDVNMIHFGTGSSKMSPETERTLQDLGLQLRELGDGWGNLRVDGHSDSRGGFAMNLQLSLDRANSVKTAIIAGGPDGGRIEARGFSEAQPLVEEENAAAWAKNRRVELRFFNVKEIDSVRKLLDKTAEKLRKQGVTTP